MRSIPQKVNWFIVGVTFILAAFFAWRNEWINAGRGFIDIDFAMIEKAFEGRTTREADQMVRHYLGRRAQVTGALSEVSPGVDATLIRLHVGDGYVFTFIYPWNWRLKRISTLPKGTVVTLNGRISGVR